MSQALLEGVRSDQFVPLTIDLQWPWMIPRGDKVFLKCILLFVYDYFVNHTPFKEHSSIVLLGSVTIDPT